MARLRMKCSNLKSHLYAMHVVESSACMCGFPNEDEFHFFLVCPLYNRPRVTLLNALANIVPLTWKTLLFGVENLDQAENEQILMETIRFIRESKRFE